MSKYITNYARDRLLIALVKANPNLYDSTWAVPVEDAEGRPCIRSKDDAWLDIAEEIDKEYPASMYELQSIEEKVAYIKGRWRNIKNVFVREMGKGTAPQWPLFDDCQWYAAYVKKKSNCMNASMPMLSLDELPGFTDGERVDLKYDSRVSDLTAAVSSPQSSDDMKIATPGASSTQKRTYADGPGNQRSDVVLVSERLENQPKFSRTVPNRVTNSDAHDECTFFGMQVASYLRKLPDHKALEAKSEVLKVLSKHF